MDLNSLKLRELQVESAIAIQVLTNMGGNIHQFNKRAHHDSQQWYRAVLEWYFDEFGGLPSEIGPGKDINLVKV